MTSADISYQSRLSKLVMILSSSTHAPYDTDTFPFYLCHTILFSFKPICFSIGFPSFSTYPFVLFLFFTFTFGFPFILLILLFPLSTCILLQFVSLLFLHPLLVHMSSMPSPHCLTSYLHTSPLPHVYQMLLHNTPFPHFHHMFILLLPHVLTYIYK